MARRLTDRMNRGIGEDVRFSARRHAIGRCLLHGSMRRFSSAFWPTVVAAVALSLGCAHTQQVNVYTGSREAFIDSYSTVFHGKIIEGGFTAKKTIDNYLLGSQRSDVPSYADVSFKVLSVLKGDEDRDVVPFRRVLDGKKTFVFRIGDEFLVGLNPLNRNQRIGFYPVETADALYKN